MNPALVETDLVVVVTAAGSKPHSTAGQTACRAGAKRKSGSAFSLLETTASQGWHLAVALERTLARRVPLIGVSLVLNHPEVSGALRGYPVQPETLSYAAAGSRDSPLRYHLLGAAGRSARRAILRSVPTERTVAAAFGGPPSVAHAEALLRAVELRRTELGGHL